PYFHKPLITLSRNNNLFIFYQRAASTSAFSNSRMQLTVIDIVFMLTAHLITRVDALADDAPTSPTPVYEEKPFTLSSSCVLTVTVTTNLGTDRGCAFNCSSDFCIIDRETGPYPRSFSYAYLLIIVADFVTLPCGCSGAASVVTRTITACAKSSPCWNCHTGFPFTTTASDCPEPTADE
ncbi:hypothetical protein TGAM01_v200257, partial [Trichoderma gamsii]